MGGAWRGVKFCLVLGALLQGTTARAKTPDVPRTLPEPYVALAFENRSPVLSIQWMRVALPFALAEKLEAHPGLRPVYGELVVPPGPVVPAEPARIAEVARQTGARLLWTGNFARADWKLELGLKLWTFDGSAATLVGEEKRRGEFSDCFEMLDDMAVALLDKAQRPVPREHEAKLRRAPTKDFYAFTLMGRGLESLHGVGAAPNLVKAEKDVARSVFIDPKLAEGHRLMAVLLAAKGKAASARGQLSYAIDLRPDYYAPLVSLIRQAHKAKARDEAIELAERALGLRPWDLEVRYLLGEMLWENGDTDGAERELERVVKVEPRHVAARRVLVLVHSAKGQNAELAEQLEAIIKLDEKDERSRLDLGAAYHALGRDEDAISIYRTIVEQNPRHLQAMKFLGDIHQARGDLAGAIGWYERALAANRGDPRPYFLLGAVYLSAGKDAQAMRIYKQAQRFPRYLGETYSNLGALHLKRGENDAALWYLKVATQKKPQNARIRYNYGLALAKKRSRDEALAQFQRAAELDPDEAEFRFALGVALLRLGRLEEAERALVAAVRLDPRHEDARHNLVLIEELRRRAKEGEIQIE